MSRNYDEIWNKLNMNDDLENHLCKRKPGDLRPCAVCMAWIGLANALAEDRQERRRIEYLEEDR